MRLIVYMFSCLIVTSLCTSDVTCLDSKKSENNEETIEEEEEWRILEKDETVPRGSHVQLDLTTHERRIKVVSRTKSDSKNSVIPIENPDERENKDVNSETLHHRLHKIYGDDPNNLDKDVKNKQQKYRSYEELKKDFEELKMAVKTDIEIMNGIIESYKELIDDKFKTNFETQEQQVSMLVDLEYLLHQIDNANEFVKSGGLTNIILPSLNSTSPEVRTSTARVLGSAAQSNTVVQIAALEAGAIGVLLRIVALDSTPSVRSSALYALSCLVRRFPIAQKKFVDEGGLTVLKNIYNSDTGDTLKIQVKVITFIHDLIVEKQDAERTLSSITLEENSNSSNVSIEEAKERLRQYNIIGLETKLQEQRWCQQLSTLIKSQVSQHLDKILATIQSVSFDGGPEHDVIEKVVGALISSSSLCLSDLKDDSELGTVIRILTGWYTKLTVTDDEDDDYFSSLVKLVEKLAWKLNIKVHEHDEL